MSEPSLSALHTELSATHHDARVRRMLELGRRAPKDPAARALLDALASGNAYERRLALAAQFTGRDGGQVLRATTDDSGRVRALAFRMVPLVCDDAQALEALRMAHAMRREQGLLRGLMARDRRAVVDGYLDWLTTLSGVQNFADAVPLATTEGLRRHLPRALAKPSLRFWARLARYAPDVLGDVLLQELRAVSGEADPVTRRQVDWLLHRIVDQAPEQGLALFELLLARGTRPDDFAWKRLVARRPAQALALVRRYPGLPLPFGLFAGTALRLDVESLRWLAGNAPTSLGNVAPLLKKLPEPARAALAEAWSAAVDVAPAWGTELLARIPDTTMRDRVYARWSVASRDANGVIALGGLTPLPADLREREARRHLHEVVALATRPEQRMTYARLLPWDEALSALQAYVGHPEGGMRGAALETLLAIPGLRAEETALVDKALALVLARKNEQDPVRGVMLQALVSWPRRVWRREHTASLGRVLRDALDAADLSYDTARSAERLLLRTLGLDAAWGAQWLGTLIKERGQLHSPRLGDHLTDDEVRTAAPQLLAIAKAWAERERGVPLVQLAASLGKRAALVPGLSELLVSVRDSTPHEALAVSLSLWLSHFERARFEATVAATMRRWYDRGWAWEIYLVADSEKEDVPLHPELVSALERVALGLGKHTERVLELLRARAVGAFDALLPRLLKQDASVVRFSVVLWHLHRRRQELLGPYLSAPVITGRFATGNTRWVLPFEDGFFRWTPEQSAAYSASLAGLCADPERDTPTVWSAVVRMAALDWGPMDALCALADDTRPAIQEKALRVMARCDQGQGVPTLLRCLEDARARVAIYGLRRAFNGMPPARVVALLAEVPLSKVTVAKEVVRLLGELRSDAAYARLLELDGQKLHRDVRIAMLRALWDHLDREPTWGVLERAVTGDDWVMAARVGDIPADRLTVESDTRLSALLGRVLARPEPEARIDLLQRAAYLAVRDPEHTFLSACGARLGSPYDDEVRAAMLALIHRCDEHRLPQLEPMLDAVAPDRRALSVALEQLLSLRTRTRAVYAQAALLAERVLAKDARLAALRVRCAAAALEPEPFAARLAEMGEAGLLHADALEACRVAVQALPPEALEPVGGRLWASPSAEARRVAVWCLVRDAGPGRGWTPERLAALAAFQGDASPLVSGAAQFVFPPREMVEAR